MRGSVSLDTCYIVPGYGLSFDDFIIFTWKKKGESQGEKCH
jgi:hypothetical protein